MSLEDYLPVKGVQSHSLRGLEILHKFSKAGPKRELLKTCLNKEKELKTSSRSKMLEQQLKACNKKLKNAEIKKYASSSSASRKHTRKAENPVQLIQSDFRCSTTWTCKNSACQNILKIDDAFCRRCSCCICHQFDDNKDPSLWLMCDSDSGPGDSCGSSCHIECAFEKKRLGVVKLGQYMQLDGSYCCFSCGKVSGILGCWKKQLAIAKDARRVDVLCYRVFLSYRLLDDTSRFKELHKMVTEAKTMLEAEVGPMNGESVKMARGIVSRLAIASDVQNLCSNAIDKAEEWLAKVPDTTLNCTVVSLPSACRFLFEEVASSSVVIILIDIPTSYTESIKGYKLWYSESRDETFPQAPDSIFTREKRRISVKNLQPCTEYTFRIVSYTDNGDLGHSEAKCFTKSVELCNKNPSPEGSKKETPTVEESISNEKGFNSDMAGTSSGFIVRDLGEVLPLALANGQSHIEGFDSADVEQCCGVAKCESLKDQKSPPVSRDLDLNVASVPDLNEDLTPPLESSRDEDNGFTLEQAAGPDDDAASHGIEKNGLAGSNGSGPSDNSRAWNPARNGDVPAVDSLMETRRKRGSSAIEETLDCDSTLINGSSLRLPDGPGSLDDNFESCVKIIRLLECQGYIKQEFRLKLLTWFSLRSTEQERRIVNTFIKTLSDDPKSLAGQLIDSFTDIISCKRPKIECTSVPS